MVSADFVFSALRSAPFRPSPLETATRSVPMTPEAMLGWTPFSYPFNLTQQPACTVPSGLTRDGLLDRVRHLRLRER